MPEHMDNKIKMALAGIILLTFLVYFPSLNNGFTNWDDLDQVVENPHVHTLTLGNTSLIFTSFYVGMYQPLTSQFYGLIYSVFGESATAFHVFSLLLHLINVLLVFYLVRIFCRRNAPALITAALFALNPLQVESISWISATSNLLYALFYFSAIITYIKYVRQAKRLYLFYTLLLFTLSLLSKPTAITFPVLIFFIDIYFRRKIKLRIILEKLPFFVLSIAIGLLIIYAREEAGHIIDVSERFGWGERILMVIYALAFYVARLFIPAGLSAFHPYPMDGLPIAYFIAPIVPIMLIYLLFRLRGEQKRQLLAGGMFFLVSIAVVLEFIPLGVQVVKERYVYLPSVGIYYAFAVLMVFLFAGRYKRLLPVVSILMLLLFSIITFARTQVWKDSISLWDDVLEQYPYASAALINRGNAWQEKEKFIQAIGDYNLAIKYEPGAADAYMNRGLANYKMANTAEALSDFDMAISLGIEDAETYNNRGLLRASTNKISEAASDFEKAVSLNPGYTDAWINLGLMLANSNQFTTAYEAFSNGLRADPASARAYFWRGMLQYNMGQTNESCRDFKAAMSYGWPADQIPLICR